MDFGKRIYCGNFVLEKRSRALGKTEMKALRDAEGVPADAAKFLTRGSLPYIRVSDIGGGWSVNIGIGLSMFDALDGLCAVRDARDCWRVPGIEGRNAEAVLTGMYVDTTSVGDAEYQTAKLKAMSEYIGRRRAVGADMADRTGAADEIDGEEDTSDEGAGAE